MYARSILWSVGDVSDCLETVHKEPYLRDNEAAIEQLHACRRTLRDIVELLRCGRIHRASNPAAVPRDQLEGLLATMYETRSAEIQTLREDGTLSDRQLSGLLAAGAIEQRAGEVFVPLGTGFAGNWPTVLGLSIERLGELTDSSDTLRRKARADGSVAGNRALIALRSLQKRLRRLWEVLRAQLGRLQMINYTVFIDDQIDRFLVDTVPEAFGVERRKELA